MDKPKRGPNGQYVATGRRKLVGSARRVSRDGDPDLHRVRDQERKARERKEKKELLARGEPMPAVRPNGGTASRKLKEEAMAELVVVRRCWDCGQAFEAKVKDETCPWCQ